MKIEFKNLDSYNNIYKYLDVFLTLTYSNGFKRKFKINGKKELIEKENV